jgi:hypothetical protein
MHYTYDYNESVPKIEFTYNSSNLKIYHLSHGEKNKRNYCNIKQKVIEYFKKNNINNIWELLYYRTDNILEITPMFKKSFNLLLLKYFNNRDEDN